jgi:hypothetical protein
MKRKVLALVAGLLLTVATSAANATEFVLNEFAVNKIFNSGGYDISGTPSYSGSGSFNLNYSGVGSYTVLSFFDYEISPNVTGFYPEYGDANGNRADRIWQIGTPGSLVGDPLDPLNYGNFLTGALSNTSALPNGNNAGDVAVALGYSFNLSPTETAYLSFSVTDTLPVSGFYLFQTDAYDGTSLYYTSSLSILDTGENNPVPEPSTFLLFGSAMAGLALYRKKTRKPA